MKRLIVMILLLVSAQAVLATDVSGTLGVTTTWIKTESPYNLTTTVTVPAGGTLTIEPGVVVNVDNQRIICRGVLTARGTETDSIIISGGGIDLVRSGVHRLQYVRISGSIKETDEAHGGGLVCDGSIARLSHCVITRNEVNSYDSVYGSGPQRDGGGVEVADGSSIALEHCTISNNKAWSIFQGGVTITSSGTGGGMFIHTDSRVVLRSCVFTGNLVGGYAAAISVSPGSQLQAYNTLIYDNTATLETNNTGLQRVRTAPVNGGGNSELVNCTVTGNTSLDMLVTGVIGATLKNCIVWGNSSWFGPPQTMECTVSWSCVGPDTAALPGDGNIVAIPMYVDSANGDFSLAPGSPCMDIGDPTSPTDNDGTRADMGVRDASDIAIPQFSALPTIRITEGTTDSLLMANTGGASVTVQSIVLSDRFSTSMTFPLEITAGGTLIVPIAYTGPDSITGTAVVTSDDPNRSEVTVILRGVSDQIVNPVVMTSTWTTANSPYTIEEPVIVPYGETLTIEPGVVVIQKPEAILTIQGAIHVNGTEENMVVFNADSGSTRASIILDGTDSCWFNWTTIRDGRSANGGGVGITRTDCSVTFNDCQFIENSAYYSYISNRIEIFVGDGGAIWVGAAAKVRVSRCEFVGNSGVFSAVLWTGSGAQLTVNHSIFRQSRHPSVAYNPQETQRVIFVGEGTTMTMDHCTFSMNQQIDLYSEGTVVLSNSILNGIADVGVRTMNYCLTAVKEDLTGEGNIVTDPLFNNPATGVLSLKWGSPCIDAGDPSLTDPDGTRTDIGAIYFPHGVGVESITPAVFTLSQNAPNPFNPVTTIPFSLKTASDASLSIYNVQGQLVKTLVSGHHTVGQHTAVWNGTTNNGRQVASGVYFYRLVTDQGTRVRRMTLVR
jgi:hypothetical protein